MEPGEFTDNRFGWRHIACADSEARLWLVDVRADAAPPDSALALSRDEMDRAERFYREEDRARFMLTRAALRHLLAEATDLAPEKLVFLRGPHGKPSLAGRADLNFNVSHSGARALIGISARRHIGVDIEQTREKIDERALAEAFFCASELRCIESLDGAERRAAFYKIWTCKEAVLKAFGVGISQYIKDFRVRLRPQGVDLEPEPNCFTPALADVRAGLVDVPGGYAAAFALT
jgi:4'-phosphopantetheinyl transferase